MAKKLIVAGGKLIRKTPDPQIKTGYGALYNWYAVDESASNGGFITGYHVPSDAEWSVLEDYIQAQIDANVLPNVGIGNILKSCRQVNSPLGGDCATTVHPKWNEYATEYGRDSVKFSGIPGGDRISGPFIDGFFNINSTGAWWCIDESTSTNAWRRSLHYNYSTVGDGSFNKEYGYSIRCLRTSALTTAESALADGTIIDTVQDYNGNYYELVKIGSQIWTAQNIRATNYMDGTAIDLVTENVAWSERTEGAYCWYNNDPNTAGIVYTDEEIVGKKGLVSS